MGQGGDVPSPSRDFDRIWSEIAAEQDGIIARRQLFSAGLTPGVARRAVVARRWLTLYPCVYATFSGAVPDRAQIWAALLRAGPGATASHRTALWLAGLIDERPGVIEVAIPHGRRHVASGMRVYRMRNLDQFTHPAARPPRLRLEQAILATTQSAQSEDVVLDFVLRSTQRRLTTAARLQLALKAWPRHRWRSLLLKVLAEVQDGVASALELRYARDVERAHGLPRGQRNQRDHASDGSRYRDVQYAEFNTVVELDGREAHPVDEAFRDLRRDNAVAASGGQTLRYGWRDTVGRSCLTAAQVGQALRHRGWTGRVHRCGPACSIPP